MPIWRLSKYSNLTSPDDLNDKVVGSLDDFKSSNTDSNTNWYYLGGAKYEEFKKEVINDISNGTSKHDFVQKVIDYNNRIGDGQKPIDLEKIKAIFLDKSIQVPFAELAFQDIGFHTYEKYLTRIEDVIFEDSFDLHRPYIDRVVCIKSTSLGRPAIFIREPDLIDVWFDSGAMPYAQWHYPFDNEQVFNDNFPADFIAEGIDQTRGWFFTLHVLGVFLHDSVAFKNVIANGLVLDKNGSKMSKRLGNAVDPFKTLPKYGADPVRWYMISNAPPWDNLKFNEEGIVEVQRRFFGTLQNTFNFFAIYANLDDFDYASEADIPLKERSESDRWIISRLHTLRKEVAEAYDSYEPTRAARLIQEFTIEDLSNWYVRLNRKRFWKSELNEDKRAAYRTLYECLESVVIMASPIAPFYSDYLYRALHKVEADSSLSVHLATFPQANPEAMDSEREICMQYAQRISSLVHSLRKREKIRVRQPLQKILLATADEKMEARVAAVSEIIKGEVNIKEIEFIGMDSEMLVKKIKPNFPKLGKQYGKRMKEISQAVEQMSQDDIREMEEKGAFTLPLSEPITLSLDEVEISSQDIPGWLVANEEEITVALDVQVTDTLKQEGAARDFVNRIQNLRKDKGLDVQDKISLRILKNGDWITQAFDAHKGYICDETQALSLEFVESASDTEPIEIEDHKVEVLMAVER
ncbi:MAG: class I tRNA ligase family protein [Bernardetiaceae bacterium]|nr:class I tRNA ligase family protein [Bernardetiaceae bacterium]